MTASFVLTPLAENDLDEIWEYIASDNLDASDRVLDAVDEAFHNLARNPRMGHHREELVGKQYRFWLVHSYLIVYRWQTKPIQIIRVLHAARDVQALLDLIS